MSNRSVSADVGFAGINTAPPVGPGKTVANAEPRNCAPSDTQTNNRIVKPHRFLSKNDFGNITMNRLFNLRLESLNASYKPLAASQCIGDCALFN